MLQNRRFSVWAGFGAAICVAIVRNSSAFCNSVSADRRGMAASRFLAAAGACKIIVCFPAEGRKSHCTGSMKVVMAADFFLILVLIIVDFGTNSLLKKIVPTRSTEHNHIKDCLWWSDALVLRVTSWHMICTWWRKPSWMSTFDVEIPLPPLLGSCACTCGLRVWATGPHVWRHTLHTQPAPPLPCKGSSSVYTT